jgi:hypothetical protein
MDLEFAGASNSNSAQSPTRMIALSADSIASGIGNCRFHETGRAGGPSVKIGTARGKSS